MHRTSTSHSSSRTRTHVRKGNRCNEMVLRPLRTFRRNTNLHHRKSNQDDLSEEMEIQNRRRCTLRRTLRTRQNKEANQITVLVSHGKGRPRIYRILCRMPNEMQKNQSNTITTNRSQRCSTKNGRRFMRTAPRNWKRKQVHRQLCWHVQQIRCQHTSTGYKSMFSSDDIPQRSCLQIRDTNGIDLR